MTDTTKSEVRARIRRWRAGLAPDWVAAASARITAQLQAHPAVIAAETICVYMSTPGEVATRELAQWILSAGKRLIAPRVVRGSRAMTLHLIADLERDLMPGLWGIPTPHDTIAEVDARSLDVAIVPGLAFDRQRNRIGNGGGYYDRLLAITPYMHSIGVFFAAQEIPTCWPEAWDQRLGEIVTEEGIRH